MLGSTSRVLAINGGEPVRKRPIREVTDFGSEGKEAVAGVLDSGVVAPWYGGPRLREFERKFAELHGKRFAVAVNSGTSALHLACVALGIGRGDEVIMPALAYVSAVSVVVQQNAVPVFADVDSETWVLSAADVARKVGPRTRAVMPVHFFGQPVDMDALVRVARRYSLHIIEDCGQAHGARFRGRLVGTVGDVGSWSLAARKHVTCGEGGINVTDDPDLARTMKALAYKGKGPVDRYEHLMMGYNYALGEIEAALGLVSLGRFEDELKRRVRNAELCRERLRDSGLMFPNSRRSEEHAFFKVAMLLPDNLSGYRNWFAEAVCAENVSVEYYPLLYEIPWIRERETPGSCGPTGQRSWSRDFDCPVAGNIATRLITVPTCISSAEIEETCEAILKVLACLR